MTIREAAEQIKGSVSSADVAALYGYRPGRGGYICCPFHGEKTASLKLHRSGWYCYGCGRGGSVIDFVMAHEGCGFSDAVKAIDHHMGLNLRPGRPDGFLADVSATRRRSELETAKKAVCEGIDMIIGAAEAQSRLWWMQYADAYQAPAAERTALQWDNVSNARAWCMYYDDLIGRLKKEREEVTRWSLRANHRSA